MVLRTGLIACLALSGVGDAVIASPSAQAPAAVAAAPRADSDRVEPHTLQDDLARADSLVAARGGPSAENARLYLTWDAPYGMPRASRSHSPRSRDPLAVDTLWLSFLPGRTSVGFLACTAELEFRSAPGDTLGPWWHLEAGGLNRGQLTLESGPDSTFPQPQPWTTRGLSAITLITRTSTSTRVGLLVAVPYTSAVPVNPDSVYTLCRLLLRHQRVLPGCAQPVCVEWTKAALSYWLKDEPTVTRGERFVSYASDTLVCAGYVPRDAQKPATSPATDSRARPARHRKPKR